MVLEYKPDLERAKTCWRAYWEGEIIDRPIVCVRAPKAGSAPVVPPRYMDGVYGDFADAVGRYDQYAKNTVFAGESLPNMPISFGPDQFALFIGGDFTVSDETATSWIHPYVESWRDTSFALDTVAGSLYNRMLEFIREARRQGKDKFLISMIDLHSAMDCLSAMRGPQNLCFDLYDCPEDVEEANNKARALYRPVYDALFAAGEMEITGSIGWMPLYYEGKFAVVQCDFMGLIGNADAKKLVMPALEEESAYLDRCILHLDGKDALRHLDDILAIERINAIQWVPGDGQPKTYEWMELLQTIQRAGKGLYLYDWSVEAIHAHYKELRPEGLVFDLEAKTEGESEALLKWMKENT